MFDKEERGREREGRGGERGGGRMEREKGEQRWGGCVVTKKSKQKGRPGSGGRTRKGLQGEFEYEKR
jgi:hypothetical protein